MGVDEGEMFFPAATEKEEIVRRISNVSNVTEAERRISVLITDIPEAEQAAWLDRSQDLRSLSDYRSFLASLQAAILMK